MTEKASFDIKDLSKMYDNWFLLHFFQKDMSMPFGAISILKNLGLKSLSASSAYILDKLTNKDGSSCPVLEGMYLFRMNDVKFPEESEDGIGVIVNGYIGKTHLLSRTEESADFFNNSSPTLRVDAKQAENLKEYKLQWSEEVTIYVTTESEKGVLDCGGLAK